MGCSNPPVTRGAHPGEARLSAVTDSMGYKCSALFEHPGECVDRRECPPDGALVSGRSQSCGPVYLKDCPPPKGVSAFLPVHCGSPHFSNSISLIPHEYRWLSRSRMHVPERAFHYPLRAPLMAIRPTALCAEAASRVEQHSHFLADLHRFHCGVVDRFRNPDCGLCDRGDLGIQ